MAIKLNRAIRTSRKIFLLCEPWPEPSKNTVRSESGGVMLDAPLINRYLPDDILAWDSNGPRTVREFVSDVSRLCDALPDRPALLNLLSNRYEFLVGFGAAMLRHQVPLLPQSRAPETLCLVAREYEESYCLTNTGESIEGIDCVMLPLRTDTAYWPGRIPRVPLSQIVAIAFTSGSTGKPMPNHKTWGALVSVAHATASRFGVKAFNPNGVVATVPHQHMFGLEASVMLPIQHGLVMHAGRPLF